MKHLKRIVQRFKSDGFVEASKHYFGIIYTLVLRFFSFVLEGLTNFIIALERCFPLKEYIVFECESDMDDNPRALYEYFLKTHFNMRHKLIWIVKDTDLCRRLYSEKNVKFYNRNDKGRLNRIRLNYYLGISKFFVFSHPYWFCKKNTKQCVINLWHGTPAKGPDLQHGKLKNCFDIITISNKNVEPFYNQFIDYNKEQVIYCGMPRNDYLSNINISTRNEIKRKIGIPLNDKLIICMPTFKKSIRVRDFDVIDKYSLGVIEEEKDLININDFLKQRNIHIVVKLHPLQDLSETLSVEMSNVHYTYNSDLFEKKIILYELLACSDALLTDFSSVYFDYLILNKPVGFFTNILAQSKRGAMVTNPEDYMAGEKINDIKGLLDFIDNLYKDKDIYESERIKMNEFFNDGNRKSNSEFITNKFIK